MLDLENFPQKKESGKNTWKCVKFSQAIHRWQEQEKVEQKQTRESVRQRSSKNEDMRDTSQMEHLQEDRAARSVWETPPLPLHTSGQKKKKPPKFLLPLSCHPQKTDNTPTLRDGVYSDILKHESFYNIHSNSVSQPRLPQTSWLKKKPHNENSVKTNNSHFKIYFISYLHTPIVCLPFSFQHL